MANPRFSLKMSFGIGAEKHDFLESLALLLSSGIDILSALSAIKNDVHSSQLRKIVQRLEHDIGEGRPLWRALDNARIFPQTAVSLVRIGEESGRLTENLRVVVEQERKARLFHSRLRSAMLYPGLVFGLSVVVALGTSWFILPRLQMVFSQLDVELPLATKALIAAGNFLGSYGTIAVPSTIAVFALVFWLLFFLPATKVSGEWILLRIPAFRMLIRNIEISRFGYLLGTMLNAGVPLLAAVESLAQASGSPTYRTFYSALCQDLEQGFSFKKSFNRIPHASRLVPMPVQQIISAGEQSGKLADALLTISEAFEQRANTAMKNLTVLIEPILLFIVWIGVLIVALGIIAPIYNLIGQLNT